MSTPGAGRRQVEQTNEAPTNSIRNDIADAAAQTLRTHPTVLRAILFGSRARGDHRPDSDWDIALIVGETATPYNTIEAQLSTLPGVSPMCVREAAMLRYAHRTDTVHAAIAREGITIAGPAAKPGAAAVRSRVGWTAVKAQLAEAQRTICALACDDVKRRIAPFTRRTVIAFATAQALTLKIVPKGRKDADALLAQLRLHSAAEDRRRNEPLKAMIEAGSSALRIQWGTREEAVGGVLALNHAWCDAQPMERSGERHCVAVHLDAIRIEFASAAGNRRGRFGASASRERARCHGAAQRHLQDQSINASNPMENQPDGVARTSPAHGTRRLNSRAQARAALGARLRTRPDVHRSSARRARITRHNNVARLNRAHPDHWVRNPHL